MIQGYVYVNSESVVVLMSPSELSLDELSLDGLTRRQKF